MGTAPMVPLPSNVEEIVEESNLGSLPAISSAEESISRAVAVPSRKVQPDPSEEDHNFYHTVGSPTSVVDLFDLCSKSNWHRQCNAAGAPVVVDDTNAASSAQSMEVASSSTKFQNITQGDFMDCLTDDLVLHIMDFLDVKSAVLTFGPSCRRSRTLSRYSAACLLLTPLICFLCPAFILTHVPGLKAGRSPAPLPLRWPRVIPDPHAGTGSHGGAWTCGTGCPCPTTAPRSGPCTAGPSPWRTRAPTARARTASPAASGCAASPPVSPPAPPPSRHRPLCVLRSRWDGGC